MSVAAPDQWKQKYYQQLDLIDRKQKSWEGLEGLLRFTINRLSLAAEGQNEKLDRPIQSLRMALKAEIDQRRLKAINDEISAAVYALDAEQPASQRQQIALLEHLLGKLTMPSGNARPQQKLLKKLARADDKLTAPLLAETLSLVQAAIPEAEATEAHKPGLFERLLPSRSHEAAEDAEAPADLTALLAVLAHLLVNLPWPEALKSESASQLVKLRKTRSATDLQQRFTELDELVARWPKNVPQDPVEADATPAPKGSEAEPQEPAAQSPAENANADNANAGNTSPDDVGALLIELMDMLIIPPALQAEADTLLGELREQPAPASWGPTLRTIAALINRIQQGLHHEKVEIESFLQQMTGRLREMDSFLETTNDNLQSAEAEGVALDEQIHHQVSGIQQDVSSATELDTLKDLVNGKLDNIASHIREYRESERERNRAATEQLDTMQERMASLEAEAQNLKQVIDEKNREANSDALTGVPNRLAFNQRIQEELKARAESGHSLYLAVWDIDLFKRVNDTYGHSVGDEVLTRVAQTINKGIRQADFFARFGGEEFVLLMPDLDQADVLDRLNILRRQVEACEFAHQQQAFEVTVSCGISCFAGSEQIEPVFERADAALYEAKHQGRNQCVFRGCG